MLELFGHILAGGPLLGRGAGFHVWRTSLWALQLISQDPKASKGPHLDMDFRKHKVTFPDKHENVILAQVTLWSGHIEKILHKCDRRVCMTNWSIGVTLQLWPTSPAPNPTPFPGGHIWCDLEGVQMIGEGHIWHLWPMMLAKFRSVTSRIVQNKHFLLPRHGPP